MAHATRHRQADLTPERREALGRTLFFELVEQLQQLYPDAPPIGSTKAAAREAIRFKANPSFVFPSAEVEAVLPSAEITDGLEVRLNLIGLYGPSSPLPTSFTERIIHTEGTTALGDFLDLFNHRFAGLLFLIWKHYRHHLRYQEMASDAISQAIAALFGLLPLAGEAIADSNRTMLLPYAGLLAMNSRSAQSIARMVMHFFDVPCQVEEFVPRWIKIPEAARFALGGTELALGVDTLLGETIEDVTGQFRVWCGPMPFARYRDFLPGRPEFAKLQRLIEFIVRDPLARDIGFLIEAETVSGWSLGEGELGWTSFLDPQKARPIEVVI